MGYIASEEQSGTRVRDLSPLGTGEVLHLPEVCCVPGTVPDILSLLLHQILTIASTENEVEEAQSGQVTFPKPQSQREGWNLE